MSAQVSLAISVGVVLIAGIFSQGQGAAQGPSPFPLADQLKEQYKLAKLVPESSSYRVAEPGTMLVVQKEGIFGVPLGSNSVDRVIYAIQKDTDLHHYNSGASNWKFGVGHKVYLSKVNIDAKRENVLFTIVECDCSDPAKPAYYKSIIDFEFPPGYLAAAELGQIEDVINQVLAIDKGTGSSPRGNTGDHRNDDLIKMVQAKLPDSVLIAKIRSSKSEFDTSSDALIDLKRAGASDAVLQAILDATTPANKDEAAPPEEPAPPAAAPAAQSFSVRHRHISLAGPGSDAIYYCSGDLSVSADGSVKYDCTQTDDPSGRCDHISIPAGYLKQAKVGSNGALHLASKGQGNFDFFGDPGTVKEVLAAIAPLTGFVPTASTSTMAPPPKPDASNCADYDSCLKKGEASLEQADGGAEALTEFEKAFGGEGLCLLADRSVRQRRLHVGQRPEAWSYTIESRLPRGNGLR